MRTVLGVDRIGEYKKVFENKRIGLITNYSGVDSNWNDNIGIFKNNGYVIKKLFTPEHGLYGCQDGKDVSDGVFDNIPIISLYGKKKKPSQDDLNDIDILVYDIQDVGLRYYTFIYTLEYCIEAASEAEIPIVVLDRPNPLGCSKISGNTISSQYSSFVGGFGLPVRYGLTIGELGAYFVTNSNIDVDYSVIKMMNYSRGMTYKETGQLWNIPSPALPSIEATICYCGGCFFEATNVSEGRGTPRPFQMYGAPYINMDDLYYAVKRNIKSNGIAYRKRAFVPQNSKYSNEVCYGIEFQPIEYSFDFIQIALVLMKTIRCLYPEEFKLKSNVDGSLHICELAGSKDIIDYLENKIELGDLLAMWKDNCRQFQDASQKIFIYKV